MIRFDKETVDKRREILREHLSTGIAEVTFNKVDGTVRVMPCTLDSSIIPPAPVHVTKTKKTNPLVMSVWCTDKSEWRSFRLDNVISIEVK